MDELTQAEKFEVFLKELTALSIKYGIVIEGCGCCGSPYLEFLREDQTEHEYSVKEGGLDLALRSKASNEEMNWLNN